MSDLPTKNALARLRERVESAAHDEKRLNIDAQHMMTIPEKQADAVVIFNATAYRTAAYMNVLTMIEQESRK